MIRLVILSSREAAYARTPTLQNGDPAHRKSRWMEESHEVRARAQASARLRHRRRIGRARARRAIARHLAVDDFGDAERARARARHAGIQKGRQDLDADADRRSADPVRATHARAFERARD